MKILITGGAGFIGSHTADLYVERGYKVVVLDSFDRKIHGLTRPSYLNPKVKYIRGNVSRAKDWLRADLKTAEVIIHLAAQTDILESFLRPQKYTFVNSYGTSILYSLILKLRLKPKHILVASSEAIYGEGTYKCGSCGNFLAPSRSLDFLKKKVWNTYCPYCGKIAEKVPSCENDCPNITSNYALTKYFQEQMVLFYGRALTIPSTAMRYFNVYGPRQSLRNPYSGVCMNFINKIKQNKPFEITEDGNQKRDFIFVKDVARVNMLAIEKNRSVGVFNVGSGVSTKVIDLARAFQELVSEKVKIMITDDFRLGDIRNGGGSIDKIRKKLGFKPKTSLKEGLKKLLSYEKLI